MKQTKQMEKNKWNVQQPWASHFEELYTWMSMKWPTFKSHCNNVINDRFKYIYKWILTALKLKTENTITEDTETVVILVV